MSASVNLKRNRQNKKVANPQVCNFFVLKAGSSFYSDSISAWAQRRPSTADEVIPPA